MPLTYRVPPYFGGKSVLAPWINSIIPPCKTYVEPFGGMGSVLVSRQPCHKEVLNDLDEAVWTWWLAVRDHGDELRARLAATPYGHAALHEALDILRNRPDAGTVEIGAAVAVTLCMGRTRALGQSGLWLATARKDSRPRGWISFVDALPFLTDRLRAVELRCQDAADLVREFADSPDAVIYCDPPYAVASSKQRYRADFDAEAFADAVRDASAMIVLSSYQGEYEELNDVLPWRSTKKIQSRLGNWNPKSPKKIVTELLRSNQPLIRRQGSLDL